MNTTHTHTYARVRVSNALKRIVSPHNTIPVQETLNEDQTSFVSVAISSLGWLMAAGTKFSWLFLFHLVLLSLVGNQYNNVSVIWLFTQCSMTYEYKPSEIAFQSNWNGFLSTIWIWIYDAVYTVLNFSLLL